MIDLEFTLNGATESLAVQGNWTLLEVLRDRFGLTGTKEGCGVGVCGTRTVLLDGRPVSSCLLLATNVAARNVLTVEGLSVEGRLDPVQQAFLESTAFQCAFCTAGMMMTVKALLTAAPAAGEDEIKDYLAGNLCRCGTYLEVFAAVKRARDLDQARTNG